MPLPSDKCITTLLTIPYLFLLHSAVINLTVTPNSADLSCHVVFVTKLRKCFTAHENGFFLRGLASCQGRDLQYDNAQADSVSKNKLSLFLLFRLVPGPVVMSPGDQRDHQT